jgi:hypothetical protein
MSWFKDYKIASAFYRQVVSDEYVTAMSPAAEFRKKDMKRWTELHKLLAETVGIDPKQSIDDFIELSDVFRELTDRLGHLPSETDFVTAWRSWKLYKHEKNTEEVEEFDYPGGGKTHVPQHDPMPLVD